MDEKTKEALSLWRSITNGQGPYEARAYCTRQLANAFAAEHPPDDDEEISDQWLDAVGFDEGCIEYESGGYDCEFWVTQDALRGTWRASVNNFFQGTAACGARLCTVKTRVDVRRLCQALGVPLQE